MKRYSVLLLAVFIALLSACPTSGGGGGNGDDEKKETPPDKKTRVCFINKNDFSVTVYGDYSRLSKITDAAANSETDEIEIAPNSNAVFYLTYHIVIDDVTFSYDGQGLPVDISNTEKTARVLIPLLSEFDAADLTKPVTSGVSIKMQNASSFPISLKRGAYEEIPQGASSPIVNGGETARYLVYSGPVSNYSFLKNTVTALSFPAGLTEFVSGHLYSFRYDGSQLLLLADKPLTIAQALKILPPENISARSLANGHISLVWDKTGTETGYTIYRSDSETGSYTSVGTANVTSYTDTAVVVGSTYYYRISSLKNNVESDKSATVVSARAEINSLSSPDGLTVTGQTAESISLSWQSVPDATGYKVYHGPDPDTVTEYVAEISSTFYTVTGLGVNTAYYFTVSSVNESGESLPSAAVRGTTAETTLDAPAGLTVSARTQSSITLSWQAVSGAEGYRVSRSVSSGGPFNPIQTTASTSYTDNAGLTAGTTYYYRVAAYKGQNESNAAVISGTTVSGEGTIPPPPAKPAGLVVSDTGSGSVSLSWNSVATAVSYDIYRANSQNGASAKIGTETGTFYTDYTVGAGAVYYYSVRAVNGSGGSPYSDRAFAFAASYYSLPNYSSSQLMNLPAGSKHYYRLAVTAAQGITITWQNGSSQNADWYIRCAAWQNDGTAIFTNATNGYTSPQVFTAAQEGYVTVEVSNVHGSASLNYQIYY
jgi:fibronectin type 3 domain-containing protein